MQEWRVIEDGPQDGESNMAIDRAILASCASGKTLPTLRLYSWERPTLTVGYAQDFAKEIDTNRNIFQTTILIRNKFLVRGFC